MTTPTPRTAKWKTYALGAGVVALIAICLFALTRDDKPGASEVYSRIASLTSCSALQAEFDTASAAHTRDNARGRPDLAEIDTSYMEAAGERMKELHCR